MAGTLELWGPRLGPLMPSSKGGADEGTSRCENLGNRGILQRFLFIQSRLVVASLDAPLSLFTFPSSALVSDRWLLHKVELMKQTHFLLRKSQNHLCSSHGETQLLEKWVGEVALQPGRLSVTWRAC